MGALVCYQYCTDHQTSDKRLFATFARTRPPDTHISKSVVAVLRAFNWTTVSQSSPIYLPPFELAFQLQQRECECAFSLSLSFSLAAASNQIGVAPVRVTRDFIASGRITFCGWPDLCFFTLFIFALGHRVLKKRA